jgi:hypothetical protein
MNTLTHNLAPKWSRAGVLFNVPPARSRGPLDLEQLLVDTAHECPADPRLFIEAVTWLSRYSTFVAAHRLKRLALEHLTPDDQATLGLLIETAVEHGAHKYLRKVVTPGLPTAPEPGPLFDVDRTWLAGSLEEDATELSRHWGRWCQAIEPNPDILRPLEWILSRNPSFRERAIRKGDLRASILETLRRDVKEAVTELELARLCEATPVAVRNALSELLLETADLHLQSGRGRHGSQVWYGKPAHS